MGIYDRPYYQEERGAWLSGRSMVVNLVLLNGVVYLAQLLFDGPQARFTRALALHDDLLAKPWQAYQLLTYGFAHDTDSILHILYNMFGLWFFGSDLEGIYGRFEFLRLYLVAVVLAGLAWLGVQATTDGGAELIGASGGVMAVIILFVLHFPRRPIYIWGVLPVPAWVLGGLYVLGDLSGFAADRASQVANIAHLAGAAFGFVYYAAGLNLGRMIPRRLSDVTRGGWRLRPRLKIHDPEQEARDLGAKVDEILEKISRQGEASLTKRERRTLEEASRRYQRRRQ